MNAFVAIVFASLLSRLGYQMARSPVLPIFAADLGALPELIGVIVAASTVTGVFFKLPSGALSDVLGRKRMMVLGALFFAAPPFLYPFVHDPWSLLVLRFVHGFATAIFSPVASAYVASLGEIGRNTATLVELILTEKTHPAQGFRACVGILRLAKSYGAARLAAACTRALEIGARSYTSVSSILKTNRDRQRPATATDEPAIVHSNIRGPRYFN